MLFVVWFRESPAHITLQHASGITWRFTAYGPDYGFDYNPYNHGDEPAFQQAATTVTPIVLEDVEDGCACECSPGGCTPFTAALKGLFGSAALKDEGTTTLDPERRIAISATLSSSLLGLFGGRFSMGYLRATIRYVTHEAIGLRHTCCGKYGYVFITRSFLNELDEMEDDDAADYDAGHQRFHQVIAELFDELESFDDGLGVMGIKTAQQYIENSWLTRMESDLSGGGRGEPDKEDFDELVERTQELGIVWNGPLTKDDDAVVVDYAGLEGRLSSLDIWVADADKIMRGESTSGGCLDTLICLQMAKHRGDIPSAAY